MTIIKGVDFRSFYHLPSLEQSIKERYGVDAKTKKPFDIQEISKRIGEQPSLLLCAMLSNQHCSVFGVKCLIEVLAGIAESQPINVSCLDYGENQTRPFNFTLTTTGFLKELFEPINLGLGDRNHATAHFNFVPEYRVSKSELRELTEINGFFELDLKIDMGITIFYDCPIQNNGKRKSETIPVGSVVVEFDGPTHLSDEQVRKDKIRDSMVQSNGCTVFRVQMPYKHPGRGSTELNRESLSAMIDGQVKDIKNHFENRLFATINASYLLKSLSEKSLSEK